MCAIVAAVYFFTHPLDKPELRAPEGVILGTMASSSRRFPWALLVSGVCHGAFLALALVPRTASSSEPALAPDHWTDSSAGAVTELLPAELLEAPSESAPSAPSPDSGPSEPVAASPPAAPAPEAPARPAPRPVAKAEKPATKRTDEPRQTTPKAAKSEPAKGDRQADRGEPARGDDASDRGDADPDEKSGPTRPRRPLFRPNFRAPRQLPPRQDVPKLSAEVASQGTTAPSSKGSAGASESAGGTSSAGASVGQVGAPTVRDFGMSFTRAIGPAGQPDRAWASLPVGAVGVAEVAIDVSAEGKIEGVTPLGKNPSEPLVKLSKQVVAILRSGFFALRGPEPTAGRQVLRLTATTSDVAADVQGGVPEIMFGYSTGRGMSTFTQSQGRRVEVKVELLRVEAR